jgi:general secretion pathway protein D
VLGAVAQAGQAAPGQQQAQGAAAQAPQQAGQGGQGRAPSFSVNKQAGILSVFGTQRQHLAIRDYLEQLRRSVGSQVLIEAKVLNVRLDEEHRFGINWRALIGGASITGNFVSPVSGATDLLTIDTGGDDLSAVANLIEDFGTVRALSSPRLTVLQNQTAVLKVAEEEVFFEIDSQPPVISEGEVIASTPDTEINTVSVGLVMTVQPFINTATRDVTLTLRPSVTRIVRRVSDPIVPASVVPVIAAQEMDSVVTMRSGQVVVMGGLMQDSTSVNEAGVPVISEIPWLGRLFKGRSETVEKEELVVLLRATILNGRGYDPYDAELYNRFGRDRRPFRMRQ